MTTYAGYTGLRGWLERRRDIREYQRSLKEWERAGQPLKVLRPNGRYTAALTTVRLFGLSPDEVRSAIDFAKTRGWQP